MTISTIGNNGLALTSPLPVLQGGTGVTTSTGTGNNVLSTSPTLVAPVIGNATGTSLTTTGAVTEIGQFSSESTMSFKNRIINGGMVIDQRNAGASVTPTSQQFSVDRYSCGLTQASKYTAQQNAGAITPPTGFSNYLGITSSSAYSVLVGDAFYINQSIEGYNVADLGFGTANASSFTLSFKVYSSLTGTFGVVFKNSANTRSYPATYSIPVANTWTTISITIAGDTTGTWLTTNASGLKCTFGLGSGATYSGTAGSWSANDYYSATGAVSVVGTSGATFYITGVQLEKGSVATSFDYRPYSTELSLCQRYLPALVGYASGWWLSTTQVYSTVPFFVAARTAPTGITALGSVPNYQVRTMVGLPNGLTSLTFVEASTSSGVVYAQVAAGGSTGAGTLLTTQGQTLLFTGCEL